MSRGVTRCSEVCEHIIQLRRSKLALLADDLLSRVRCVVPETPAELLGCLSAAATRLLVLPADGDDNGLRAELRSCLWDMRVSLEKYETTETLRAALEDVRSSLLDVPPLIEGDEVVSVADSAALRSEMHQLMIENVLLEELRSLRLLERRVWASVTKYYPDVCVEECEKLYYASACGLGLDEYRVRGKTALANAAEKLRAALLYRSGAQLEEPVERGIYKLSSALRISLEADLAERRPAGEAMLLRPRITDIPNFAVISPHLMRGGQPNDAGVAWLKNCGVSLVIDLRGSDRGNQWAGPDFETVEDSLLATLRKPPHAPSSSPRRSSSSLSEPSTTVLRVRNLAIEDFGVPTVDMVDEFVALVDEAEADDGSCFVHCKAGIGRTGTLIACWRIAKGEPIDIALSKESLYSSHGGGLKQESFVREYGALVQARREEGVHSGDSTLES